METSTDKTMTAAVMHGNRDIRIEETPIPHALPGELLLKVATVGLCGTDAAEWAHGPNMFPINSPHHVTGHVGPMILGHEFAGRVVAVGEGVDESWMGRLVASCGAAPCGQCRECQEGRSNLCRQYSSVGLHRDGALAEYVSTPVASSIDVEQLGLDETEAALVQPMAIAVHSMRRARVNPGDVAVVQGIGGIGAFLIHALVQAGARVVAVDVNKERLEIASELGAHVAIVAGAPDTRERISAEFLNSIPVFYEVSGSESGLRLALEIVPMGTNIVAVGIQKIPQTIDVGSLTVRELSLIGTNALVREKDFPEAARLIAKRRGLWGSIAPRPLPLADLVDGALRPIAEGNPPAIKTLIRP